MKILQSKVAIITGSVSGIGKATALLFAEHGAKVVVSDIQVEKGEEVVKEITSKGGEAIFVKANSAEPEENRLLVKAAVDKFGALHIAVNNAGIGGELNLTGDYSIDGWKRVIDINLSGVFYGMKYQIEAMLKTKGASIINVASILGDVAAANSPAYLAAKHGVVGLTKTAAIEYAQKGIRVNSVGPGYIKTPLVENALDAAALKMLEGLHPIGRLGEANEVAEMILWLASDKASFCTGAYYPVDGGYLAP